MHRLDRPELLDGAVSQPDLAANLSDIARLNRLTGTRVALCRAVFSLLDHSTLDTSYLILDVGTGAADFPNALANNAHRHAIKVIAADLHGGVLRYVRQTDPTLAAIQLDGTRLPIADHSVDVITCAQTLHHLQPEQITCLMIEFARVCRIGFVLLDLERSRAAALAIRLLTLLFSTNRLTRHDGPLSARRAYRGAEIAEIAIRSGLELRIRTVFPFRWVATWQPTT